MEKKSPYFTASVASLLYIIILVMLKFLLPSSSINEGIDIKEELPNILFGAIIFWIVIFVVHLVLERRSID
ncbi:MAG: hypothetical protein Q7J35_16960 [Candidatus Methanoperedens sp.]|nr:hypothetical protein [Candidatus Methanoperedens sp.]